MSVILQNVVVVLLFTHTLALLEIANPELEDDSSGYTSVRFLGGRSHDGRRKREVGECFHDVLSFTVTVDGIDTTLQLLENTKIDLTRPVLVADDAGVIAQTVPSLVRPLVNASDVLSTLQTFVRDNGALLKPSDHTMLFSKADFFRESDGSRDLAGRAFLSRTCTDASVSFSEDLFNFITITIASHELGHCMGAGHDGPDNACFAEDSFIMAPSAQPVLGEKARNPWRFSNCSLEYFRTYVNTLDDAGTNCLLTRDPGFDPSAVDGYLAVEPGQFYSIDEQCRYSRGNGSYLCRALFDADTYPNVCQRAWCAIPNDTNCGSMVPARGTSCGDSKWCVESQCTTDPNAPTVSDACPFGDQPGEILDGVTCQDITAIDCYQSVWSNRCCQTCANFGTGNPDCLYGDRNAGCATISRGQCYSNEALCCGLCAPLKASNQIGCEFGDRATGCSAMSCASYDNATLLLCCETCEVFSTTPATTTVMTTTAIAETTTTSMPTTSTVETTTTALPTTTTAETTTTAMPTTTTVETTTTAIPTTTTAETATTAMPTTTTVETTTTAIPTTTTAETTTTAMPTTTTVETTTTAIPTTTTAETTTTAIPTTTTAETITTAMPTTTTVETTTTAMPITTTAETTTTAMPTTTTAETTTTAMPTTTTAETTTTAIPTTTTAGTTTTAMPTTTTVETTTTAMPTTTTAETTTTAMPTTTTAETTTTAMPTTTTAETTTTAMPTTITAETTTTAMPTTTTAETTTTAMPTTTTAETTTTAMTTTAERESTRGDGCVDSGGLPFSFSLDMGGLCDTSQDDCTVTTIHLSPRTPVDNTDSLTCHFRQILVDEVGSRLTGSFTAGPGVFVRCDAVQCRVPGGEIPFADGRRVFGWLVSVSNDGVAYGSEVVYLPFNGRCVSCNTQTPPVCTWDASYCYVAGECYADGLVNPLNPCEQCDSAGSPTAWAIAADTCAIGGGCVANGALNPDDNCQVCDAQESQTGFSIRRGVCNIGGRCYRDGEGNPDSACQSCDLTSPTTWKTSTVTLLGGGEAPCEDFCRYLVLYMPHHLDDVICKLGGLADSLIERVCAVEDPMAVPELNCPGTASILPRYLAFCGHTVYEAARVDPVVCPR